MPFAVIACSVVFFWVISLRAFLFTIVPTIAADLGLSPGEAGLLIGATSLAYCLIVWAAGFIPGTRKQVILAGTVISLLGMAAVALSPGPYALFASAVLAGAGSGVYLPLGLAIIVDYSAPHRRARNMSLHEVMASAGYFFGSGFVAVALPALSWREATLAWTLVGVVGLLAVAFLRDNVRSRQGAADGAGLRLDATLAASVVVFASSQVLVSGLVSVLPLIMVSGWSVGQTEAAAVVSWSRVAGLVGIGIAGISGERWRSATVVRAFFVVAALVAGLLGVVPYGGAFVVGVFVLSAASSGAVMLVSIVVAEAFPVPVRGRALSVANGISGIFALAVLPSVFGGFVDQGLASAPFIVSALTSAAAAVLIGGLGGREAALVREQG